MKLASAMSKKIAILSHGDAFIEDLEAGTPLTPHLKAGYGGRNRLSRVQGAREGP